MFYDILELLDKMPSIHKKNLKMFMDAFEL